MNTILACMAGVSVWFLLGTLVMICTPIQHKTAFEDARFMILGSVLICATIIVMAWA